MTRNPTIKGFSDGFRVKAWRETVMHSYSNVLVATGSLCLLLALVLAWCLVGVRSSSMMKRVFPRYQNLLKAHIVPAAIRYVEDGHARGKVVITV
jgi:hypothetical protein